MKRAIQWCFGVVIFTLGGAWLCAGAVFAQPSYYNFESGQVRPLALSPDGSRLFALNTPDGRLEIFDLSSGSPAHVESVPVGLEPIAVAAESDDRVWVVNHLSDSVSIVDVSSTPARVVRTLLVGDEPSDIVFAGGVDRRAFITAAHRGQNTVTPRGEFDTPGVGRADVWVFDVDSLGVSLEGDPFTILTLFGDKPRALAVSPDGASVYAAVFHSGNGTTALNEGIICDGGEMAGPCSYGGTMYPGGLPAPNANHAGVPGPEVGLIVHQEGGVGPWLDELGRDWSDGVRFELPDLDVFEIDADAPTPMSVASHAGVGTVLYAMAVNPITGTLYVANTEALNHVRFEGPGDFVTENGSKPVDEPATVRGRLHEARITVIDGSGVTPQHLNPHIPYDAIPTPNDVRERSLSTPTALAVTADGTTLYVAALGSAAVGVFDVADLEAGAVDTSADRVIDLGVDGPSGPSGLALDEARGKLYVLTRFDNSLVSVELATGTPSAPLRLHTPEPAATIVGRPLLYDARFTSSNGEASCGSCHVFGDFDSLAWDLGDPDGDVTTNPNPAGPITSQTTFHPMKGPMTTQSLRGLADHGPMHWRGDRTAGNASPAGDPLDEVGAFEEFNVAFEGLIGRDVGPLTSADMRRFADFAVGIHYPPNPIRQLDNSLRPDELLGETIFLTRSIDQVATCEGCHTYDRSEGFFGGDGSFTFEGETQDLKVPHLRNVYQKVGMFGMPAAPFISSGDNGTTGPQVRGFGFLHDGSVDTVFRFFDATVFVSFTGAPERRDTEAFMMAFDSILAPIVGQQVTLTPGSGMDAQARVDLLIARAASSVAWPGGGSAPECELVVRGVVGGEARGWLRHADGFFRSDRVGDAAIDDASLRALVVMAGQELTYTCAPPGTGARLAYDRDEDGVRDTDELDLGTDPADRPFVAIPNPLYPTLPMEGDGGVTPVSPPPDCGCALPGRNGDSSSGTAALFALLFVVATRRGRRLVGRSVRPHRRPRRLGRG